VYACSRDDPIMRVGYGRVSATPEANATSSRWLPVTRSSSTTPPGKPARRSELDEALLSASRVGDQIVIAKLDQLGRSLEHFLESSRLLQPRGVALVVLDQGIDTSTAIGQMSGCASAMCRLIPTPRP
jgi:DNA invertase Pin-like site-specific DNA recombinase